jgi:phosphomannomutase
MRYRLDGGARVVVRPSGTEPKLKCYLEVVEPVPDGDVDAARARAESALAVIRADLAVATGTG